MTLKIVYPLHVERNQSTIAEVWLDDNGQYRVDVMSLDAGVDVPLRTFKSESEAIEYARRTVAA